MSTKRTIKELLKFSAVSWSGALIKFLLFTLFNEVFKWEYWVSYLTSFIIVLIYSFILNKLVTFKSNANTAKSAILYAAFNIVFIPLSTWLIDFLTNIPWNEYLALGCLVGM